jgi:hypothetical protein
MKTKFFVIAAIIALVAFVVTVDYDDVCAQQEAPTAEDVEEAKYPIPVEFSNFWDREAEEGIPGWGLNGFDPLQVIYTEPKDAVGGPFPVNTFDFGDEGEVDALANGGDAFFHDLIVNNAVLLVSFEFEGVSVTIHDAAASVVKDTNECEEWVYAASCNLSGQYSIRADSNVWLRGIFGEPYGSATYTSTIACRAVYVQYHSSDYNDGITDIFVDDMVNPLVRIDTYNRGHWYVEIRGLSYTTHTVKVGPSHNSDWTNVIPSPHGQACDPEGDHPDCDNDFWYFCFGPSETGTGTSVYMEDIGANTSPKWSQVDLVNDTKTVDELDGLEVWGPYGSDDADYYSLIGDPVDPGLGAKVSVFYWSPPAGPSIFYVPHSDIVNAVRSLGFTGDSLFVDLDALMVWDGDYDQVWNDPDMIIFSIRESGNWDGGEIVVLPFGGPASFLNHGGHLWNTAFGVGAAFDVPTEEVDAIEAYPQQPRPQTPALTAWGLVVLVALLIVSTVFVLLKRRKAVIRA